MKLLKSLYIQVLIGVAVGIFVGWWKPEFGASLKPLGDGFVNLIKMLVAPIIFTTVVGGFAGMSDMRKLGRVGWKSLAYFEVVTTLALLIGLIVANVMQPGSGVELHANSRDVAEAATVQSKAHEQDITKFLLNIIPTTFFSAFTSGDILQVLLVSILFGCALALLGEPGARIASLLHDGAAVFFRIVGMVTRLAPLAAFGAMGYTIGKYGFASIRSLGMLLLGVYVTCLLFVIIVLGLIARLHGFSLWRTLKLIKDELMLVLGTSSSESALPSLMSKLKRLGCAESVVGVVVPAGYSFNLDGTSIYLSMGVLFLAQVTHTPLTLAQQLWILLIAALTSKGAATVTGGGLICLAATIDATKAVPAESLALIVGIDRFMSEARSITNLIGNTVATIVISKWEGEFDPIKGAALKADAPLSEDVVADAAD